MQALKNVSVLDDFNNQILNNVTLEIKPGDFVLIMGEKLPRETLLSVIGGLEVINSGEVYIDGIELTKFTPAQVTTLRREKFGYLLDISELDEQLTVKENVELPLLFSVVDAGQREELLTRALAMLGLTNLEKINVGRLNDWQKNKVMLARAIVHNPKVLILSEPVRVLDETKIKEVADFFVELHKSETTIIIASNMIAFQKIVRRRIEIQNGSVVELGKYSEAKVERKPRTSKTKTTAEKKPRAPRKKKVEEAINN